MTHPYRDFVMPPGPARPSWWRRVLCAIGAHRWVVVEPFVQDVIHAQCCFCTLRISTDEHLDLATSLDLCIQKVNLERSEREAGAACTLDHRTTTHAIVHMRPLDPPEFDA